MAIRRGQKTAAEVIAEECQGSILREFPSPWLDETLDRIAQAAKQGDRSARKALKLLNDKRFKK
jgi:hypothetical protein